MQARAHDGVQTRGGNTASVNHCLRSARPFVELVVGVASMHHRDFLEMHAEAPTMPLREDGGDGITAISGSLYLNKLLDSKELVTVEDRADPVTPHLSDLSSSTRGRRRYGQRGPQVGDL
jgi:hypothetical protein